MTAITTEYTWADTHAMGSMRIVLPNKKAVSTVKSKLKKIGITLIMEDSSEPLIFYTAGAAGMCPVARDQWIRFTVSGAGGTCSYTSVYHRNIPIVPSRLCHSTCECIKCEQARVERWNLRHKKDHYREMLERHTRSLYEDNGLKTCQKALKYVSDHLSTEKIPHPSKLKEAEVIKYMIEHYAQVCQAIWYINQKTEVE